MVQSAEYLSDALLVDRCLSGEEEAAAELFRQYVHRVHGTLSRTIGYHREIEDLVQEAFIQVFRSLKSFRGDSRLGTWIDRITVRVAYRHLRRNRVPTLTVSEEELEAPASADPEQRRLAREGVRRFYAALSDLSPNARIALVLHAVEGRTLAEVAELTGASRAATKLRVWRARKALEKRAAEDTILAQFLIREPEPGGQQ